MSNNDARLLNALAAFHRVMLQELGLTPDTATTELTWERFLGWLATHLATTGGHGVYELVEADESLREQIHALTESPEHAASSAGVWPQLACSHRRPPLQGLARASMALFLFFDDGVVVPLPVHMIPCTADQEPTDGRLAAWVQEHARGLSQHLMASGMDRLRQNSGIQLSLEALRVLAGGMYNFASTLEDIRTRDQFISWLRLMQSLFDPPMPDADTTARSALARSMRLSRRRPPDVPQQPPAAPEAPPDLHGGFIT